jgi:hypothetical protein
MSFAEILAETSCGSLRGRVTRMQKELKKELQYQCEHASRGIIKSGLDQTRRMVQQRMQR